MTSSSDLLETLKDYKEHLEKKKQTLSELCQMSNMLSSLMEMQEDDIVDTVLKQREAQCKQLVELCKRDNDKLVSFAQRTAETSDELGNLSRTLIELNDQATTLSEKVIEGQKQCESIFKARLDATSLALQNSVHRRKLDSAYGQACSHAAPAYLDRQR